MSTTLLPEHETTEVLDRDHRHAAPRSATPSTRA